jgi:cytochrome b561
VSTQSAHPPQGYTNTPQKYSTTAVWLHWLVAVLILCAAGFGLRLESVPLSPAKLQWISYHKWMGVTIFVVVALRLLWRLYRPAPPLPAHMPGWQKTAAHASHVLLYILMLGTPLVGWLQSSAAGYQVVWFGMMPLPMPLGKDKALADLLMSVHAAFAFTLLGLVVLHAAAAIKHHMIDRDDVLVRMLPFLRPPTREKS